MADLLDIVRAIRERRQLLGLTQRELSERTGIARTRIADLENERLPEVGMRTIFRLLSALGLELQVVADRHKRPTLDDLRNETLE
ncbi:MAG TPA: helix-turn-helix transcriptional regulator [Hyphomonadaceae bacterium]|jgi:transcriptional regulator with XRE-family HTH domain|nr:helix-turn-helix transcriptional regulator [Hyphomonadaceae bacterium]HPN06015.1 helix-turn-helix transcriptional regulator [Hyphomonadaceae bacterium]